MKAANDRKLIVAGFLPLYDFRKTLLLRRSKSRGFLPRFYELPGGNVEDGEDPRDAAKREFLEETGLGVEVLDPFNTYHSVIEDTEYVQIAYLVDCKSPFSDLRLSREHQSHLIVSYDEVGNLLITEEERGTVLKGFERFINRKK